MNSYRPSTYRSLVIGVLVALSLLLLSANFTRLLKAGGSLFFILPNQLGLLQMVGPKDVQHVELGTRDGQEIAFAQAGPYLVYSNNAPVLQAAMNMKELILQIRGVPDESQPPTQAILRGVRPYDTPFARGRPFLRVEIPKSGRYRFKFQGVAAGSRYIQPLDTTVSIVPDTISGREARIQQVFGVQIGLLLLLFSPRLLAWMRKRRILRRDRQQRRAENDAAWEKLRRGMG